MFGDIINPVDVKTNNIKLKMADKTADRVAKPENFSAENGNNLFNNVFCVNIFLNSI